MAVGTAGRIPPPCTPSLPAAATLRSVPGTGGVMGDRLAVVVVAGGRVGCGWGGKWAGRVWGTWAGHGGMGDIWAGRGGTSWLWWGMDRHLLSTQHPVLGAVSSPTNPRGTDLHVVKGNPHFLVEVGAEERHLGIALAEVVQHGEPRIHAHPHTNRLGGGAASRRPCKADAQAWGDPSPQIPA